MAMDIGRCLLVGDDLAEEGVEAVIMDGSIEGRGVVDGGLYVQGRE